MHDITLIRCDDGAIWVTSDDDQNGSETRSKGNFTEEEEFVLALLDFFGMTPREVDILLKKSETLTDFMDENEGQCIYENRGYDK